MPRAEQKIKDDGQEFEEMHKTESDAIKVEYRQQWIVNHVGNDVYMYRWGMNLALTSLRTDIVNAVSVVAGTPSSFHAFSSSITMGGSCLVKTLSSRSGLSRNIAFASVVTVCSFILTGTMGVYKILSFMSPCATMHIRLYISLPSHAVIC